jgi:hypothetical protein
VLQNGSLARFCLCNLSKADSGATTVLLDEFDAGAFQGLAQPGFVRQRYGNFPLNDFDPTDRCDPNF